MKKADDNMWVLCECCGHKLMKLVAMHGEMEIEIKCHSCKEINRIVVKKKD